MRSIYDPATLQELTSRINKLALTSQRQWGKMEVAQMLAHTSITLEIAMGERAGRKTLMGMLIGRFVKPLITNEKPFKQGMPTNPDFVVADSRDFDQEKQRLTDAFNRISKGGADRMESRKHPFFGKLTAQEWSNSIVKHLDHHLRQFGAWGRGFQ